jgi:hypothetical protein
MIQFASVKAIVMKQGLIGLVARMQYINAPRYSLKMQNARQTPTIVLTFTRISI